MTFSATKWIASMKKKKEFVPERIVSECKEMEPCTKMVFFVPQKIFSAGQKIISALKKIFSIANKIFSRAGLGDPESVDPGFSPQKSFRVRRRPSAMRSPS